VLSISSSILSGFVDDAMFLQTIAVQSTGIGRMLSESPGPSPGVKCAVYDCRVADCEQLTSDSSYDAAV